MTAYLSADFQTAHPLSGRAIVWLRDHALPLWQSDAGWDAVHGGCVESLDLTGAPNLEANKRVRVQARQLYVFAHAALLGAEGAADHTVKIADFLHQKARDHGRGGWVHLLSPDGIVVDARRDMYDQAFVLHGLAWALRATQDDRLKQFILPTLTFVDEELRHPAYGGFVESDLRELPRRQNPHMHWLEALLALFETTGDDQLIAQADAIIELFRTRFFDEKTKTLGEYFAEDWHVADGAAGQVVEPGHHFEWVWLLHKYSRLGGKHKMKAHAQALYDFACSHALTGEAGFAVDELDRSGSVMRGTRRLWPQTEAIKAHITASRWWGADTGEYIARVTEGLFDTYFNVDPTGGWQDQFDETGAPLAKSMPASSFYHLMLGFAESLDFWEKSAETPA